MGSTEAVASKASVPYAGAMADPTHPLAALAWLVEAGADEAIGEQPVDRFAAKKINPPSRGG